MRRREFMALLGGSAAAWPLAARAQQPTLPIVGFLGASSFEASAGRSLLWFKKGLGETGYVEDRNVRIEYRWADDEYERLPSLAMELVTLFDLVEKAFNQVACTVEIGAEANRIVAIASRWDVGPGTPLSGKGSDPVGVIERAGWRP